MHHTSAQTISDSDDASSAADNNGAASHPRDDITVCVNCINHSNNIMSYIHHIYTETISDSDDFNISESDIV